MKRQHMKEHPQEKGITGEKYRGKEVTSEQEGEETRKKKGEGRGYYS